MAEHSDRRQLLPLSLPPRGLSRVEAATATARKLSAPIKNKGSGPPS